MKVAGWSLLLSALLFSPPAAAARAKLVRSQPKAKAVLEQPPARIELWFNEELEPGFNSIEVKDTGATVEGKITGGAPGKNVFEGSLSGVVRSWALQQLRTTPYSRVGQGEVFGSGYSATLSSPGELEPLTKPQFSGMSRLGFLKVSARFRGALGSLTFSSSFKSLKEAASETRNLARGAG